MPTKTKPSSKSTDQAPGPLVTKIGNLCADPELRFSGDGKAYCRLRLAVSTPVTPGDWKGKQTTTYYGITAFGSMAENASESFQKGDRIIVTGRGEIRTWTDDNDVEHQEKVILADGLGPDLRFTSAEVVRERRETPAASSQTLDDEPF
jgi:single-strand DNA-binding protein